ncbi:MAG: DMT family transporter [Gammaproteobacteria bacterium]
MPSVFRSQQIAHSVLLPTLWPLVEPPLSQVLVMSLSKVSSRPALLALFALSLIWGYNWVVMKQALRYAGAYDFAALRTALGAISLFIVLRWQAKPLRPQAFKWTLLLGLLQTSGFVGLSVAALQSGGAGKTAVLVFVMPFWVLLLAWWLLDERPRGTQWLAVALALFGLVLVLEPWHLHTSLLSKALALAAGIAWALSAVLAKRLRRTTEIDLLSFTAWQMLLGSLPLLLIAALTPAAPIEWSGYFIAALFYNVLPAGALAWVLWMYVLQRLPAGTASLGTLAIPVVGVLAAWWELGERPGIYEGSGMLLIGVALAMLALLGARQARPADPDLAQE